MLWVNSVSRSLSLHCVASWFKRPVSTSLAMRSLECAQPCNNCMCLWGVITFLKGVTFDKIWTWLCVIIVTNTLNSVTVNLMHMIVRLTRISRKMIYKHPQPLFNLFMYKHKIHNFSHEGYKFTKKDFLKKSYLSIWVCYMCWNCCISLGLVVITKLLNMCKWQYSTLWSQV